MADPIIRTVVDEIIDSGVVVVDRDYRIIYINHAAKKKMGLEGRDITGRALLDVFNGLTEETSHIYRVMQTGEPLLNYRDRHIKENGIYWDMFCSTYPIFENGEIAGVVEIYTDAKNYLETRMREQAVIKQAQENSGRRKQRRSCLNGTSYGIDSIVSKNPKMLELKRKIKAIAESSTPVLIIGETGTGKEIIAQSIHNESAVRKEGQFVAQNCAALPEALMESLFFGTVRGSYTDSVDKPGLFELAHNGTILLDEIDSMDISIQGKLLRTLEENAIRRLGDSKQKRVNVRILATSNKNLKQLVEEGTFRRDLYYRLGTVQLEVPPLRQRREDIPLLAEYFICQYNEETGSRILGGADSFMDRLLSYDWPGNVRELKYVVEGACMSPDASGRKLLESDFKDNFLHRAMKKPATAKEPGPDLPGPEELDLQAGFHQAVAAFETERIKAALQKTGGNCSEAARLLKIPKQTLFNKIKKYEIKWEIIVR